MPGVTRLTSTTVQMYSALAMLCPPLVAGPGARPKRPTPDRPKPCRVTTARHGAELDRAYRGQLASRFVHHVPGGLRDEVRPDRGGLAGWRHGDARGLRHR